MLKELRSILLDDKLVSTSESKWETCNLIKIFFFIILNLFIDSYCHYRYKYHE